MVCAWQRKHVQDLILNFKKKLQNAVTFHSDQAKKNKEKYSTFYLSSITDFEWDKFYIFDEYVTNEIDVLTSPRKIDLTYKLSSLPETEKYIEDNGHLPGIPSAKEVEESGVQRGEMNAALLKKIEELTLHMIALDKKVKLLEQKPEKIKKTITLRKKNMEKANLLIASLFGLTKLNAQQIVQASLDIKSNGVNSAQVVLYKQDNLQYDTAFSNHRFGMFPLR